MEGRAVTRAWVEGWTDDRASVEGWTDARAWVEGWTSARVGATVFLPGDFRSREEEDPVVPELGPPLPPSAVEEERLLCFLGGGELLNGGPEDDEVLFEVGVEGGVDLGDGEAVGEEAGLEEGTGLGEGTGLEEGTGLGDLAGEGDRADLILTLLSSPYAVMTGGGDIEPSLILIPLEPDASPYSDMTGGGDIEPSLITLEPDLGNILCKRKFLKAFLNLTKYYLTNVLQDIRQRDITSMQILAD